MNDYIQEFSESIPDPLWNTIVIIVSIIIGIIVRLILGPIIRQQTKSNLQYSVWRSTIKHFNKILTVFIPLLVFNGLLPLMRLNEKTYAVFDKIIEISITITFALIIISITRITEDYLYHVYDVNKVDNLRERKVRTQIQFIRKLVLTLIVIITTAIILLSFESMQKIGAGLLTGVGIGGIIIGFAAQKSLGNLLAGLQIAFTQPMRIDDVLIVEGEWGKVEEINLTYVVVNIWDKRRLILPINYFIEKPFQNWTRTTAEILGIVFIYTDFTVPVDEVRKELSRLLRANQLWDGNVDVLQVTDFKEFTMEMRCLMSCRNSGEAFELRCYVRENLIKFIQNNYPETLSRTRIVLKNGDN